jgi:hypothetical protein
MGLPFERCFLKDLGARSAAGEEEMRIVERGRGGRLPSPFYENYSNDGSIKV